MAEHQEDAAKSRIYEALLQATPDLLYVFDIQHRFVYANQALLTMWECAGKTPAAKPAWNWATSPGMRPCTMKRSNR